jgi:hypothetical protein
MKQTAVEWLYDQLTSTWFDKVSGTDVLKKAKEMEKEQMLNFYMWMRMNERGEEYFHYTDEDMFEEYLKQEKNA